jgi:Bacterial SH3 domain.
MSACSSRGFGTKSPSLNEEGHRKGRPAGMGKGSGIVMKNILCGGLLLLLCLAGPTASGAAGPSFGTVTGTKVNLRAEPSTSAAVVLRFDGGELVEVLEKSGKKKGRTASLVSRGPQGNDGEEGVDIRPIFGCGRRSAEIRPSWPTAGPGCSFCRAGKAGPSWSSRSSPGTPTASPAAGYDP